MPINVIKSFADKSGKSEQEVEKLWNEIKQSAEDSGHKEDWAYITGSLKKALQLESDSSISFVEFYNLTTRLKN